MKYQFVKLKQVGFDVVTTRCMEIGKKQIGDKITIDGQEFEIMSMFKMVNHGMKI